MRRDGFQWKRMLIGMGCAAVLSAALCGAAAIMIEREVIAEMWMDGLAMGVLGLAVFAGSLAAGGGWEGAAAGLGYWMILALCGSLGETFRMARAGQNLLISAGGTGAAMLLSMHKNYAGRKHRKTRIVRLNKKLH